MSQLFTAIKFRSAAIIVAGILLIAFCESYESAANVTDHKQADSLRHNKDSVGWPATFGFGRVATTAEITAWDIDVRPDGKGLPAGSGSVANGKALYAIKCFACHGVTGEDVPGVKLPAPALVSDTTFKGRKVNTVGNYWPYASTVFDYIRRTMPYNAPGSLTDNEVYAVTAFLLSANKIIGPDAVLNAQSLPKVVMPAQKYYIEDDRKGGPEVK